MLVIGRKKHQRIILIDHVSGHRIVVAYLGRSPYHNKEHRIGIDAPPEVEIFREELEGRDDDKGAGS